MSRDYSMLCFITKYTLRLYVENTESSSRGLQRSENPYPKDLGIETALQRQQSKTLRAQKKKLRCIWLLHRDYASWKRVHRIRRNTKEMTMKRITLQFFFAVFSYKTRCKYWQFHRSSTVFSLKAEVLQQWGRKGSWISSNRRQLLDNLMTFLLSPKGHKHRESIWPVTSSNTGSCYQVPNVRKQLSVCDKLSSSPSVGLELIYFLPEYVYDLSLERVKRKIFSNPLQVTSLETQQK